MAKGKSGGGRDTGVRSERLMIWRENGPSILYTEPASASGKYGPDPSDRGSPWRE